MPDCDLPTTSGVRCDPVEFFGARAVLFGGRRPGGRRPPSAPTGYGRRRNPFSG
ncbi:hypothetical protein HMPREF9056_00979 [Actinomyces sp. oral taxon 170 str. F0386]|nr:hypothetical protein HMPREF9056_00979 [Actinomyces sp. oral taxon 170 str. F0386]